MQFGQRALGGEFDLELACKILALELLVLADIAGDHLPDLARAQQFADPFVVDPGVVAGEREILHPRIAHRVEQPFGNAAPSEPAAGDRQAIAQQAVECGSGIGIELFISTPPRCGCSRPRASARSPC